MQRPCDLRQVPPPRASASSSTPWGALAPPAAVRGRGQWNEPGPQTPDSGPGMWRLRSRGHSPSVCCRLIGCGVRLTSCLRDWQLQECGDLVCLDRHGFSGTQNTVSGTRRPLARGPLNELMSNTGLAPKLTLRTAFPLHPSKSQVGSPCGQFPLRCGCRSWERLSEGLSVRPFVGPRAQADPGLALQKIFSD